MLAGNPILFLIFLFPKKWVTLHYDNSNVNGNSRGHFAMYFLGTVDAEQFFIL